MESEINQVAFQLAAAVELTMDPNASQAQRLDAYNACEDFKEKSPLCVQCGLFLAQRPEYSHYVRHFGLQLMEHSIKYKWYTMTQEEKLFIKENVMKLVEEGMDNQLVNMLHMRDALSRVVVEMIKREWPQHWGSLLQELNQASQCGTVQTELVLLVLLRLVEDVAILQTLESGQRRKDLTQALTINMGGLFSFFLGLIDKHLAQYSSLRAAQHLNEAASHARVVKVVLLTLCGFVEWVQMVHITANDSQLLQVLCMLLNNEDFQDGAAECLLHILSRKGKADERKPLLVLFRADAMTFIFQAASTSASNNYPFLKKLTRVLTCLGTQLTSLWLKETDERPQCFQVYLEAIISFAKHPSLTLVYYANSVFHSFMKHDIISKDELFLMYLPKWVQSTGPKIIKIIYPSTKTNLSTDSPEHYAVMDYDSEDEFNGFFHRYRVELLDAFKQATVVSPMEMYEYVSSWLQAQVRREAMTPTPPGDFSTTSPVFLEWDALTLALDSVLGKVSTVTDGRRPEVSSGLALIDMCLMVEPVDPVVLSAMLSCLSALFVFLSMAPPHLTQVYLPRVLDKIFSTLVFSLPGETKTQRSRGVKNLRRHAASLMVKIAQKYPLLLLPVFSKIHSIVRDLQAKPDTLSTMEATTLQEALLLISNHICDYERQTSFVAEVVRPVQEPWLGMTSSAFSNIGAFMTYVGLDSPPREPSADDTHGQNRSQIQWCLDVISGVVKRCAWPSDPERAAQGGFLVSSSPVALYRNPAAPHVLPLLPGLLALAHSLNALTAPQSLALLSQGYKGAYNMVELERQNLLGAAGAVGGSSGGVSNSCYGGSGEDAGGGGGLPGAGGVAPITPLRRMQQFVSTTHETLYHALALTFTSLGHDAYSVPSLAHLLIASAFSNLDSVPDYRLRTTVRVFLKSFVSSCPPSSYEAVLLPVMAHFSPFMYNRLCARWQHLSEMRENGSLDDENADTQEVLEDILNRTLTKEYLDVVKVCLYGGSSGGSATVATMCPDSMDDETESTPTKAPTHADTLSDLGIKMIQNDSTCTYITLLLLKGLSWSDSLVSLKCTYLVGGVVVHLCSTGRVGPELAAHVLTSVLYGLQVHGQHDSNLGSLLLLGTLLYSILRPLTDNILKVMEQIPNVNLTDLQKLDEKMLKEVQKGVKVDKAKKEMFKKVTNPLIGCNVGQLFKKKASIRDLPRLDPAKPKRSVADPLATDNSLASLFDPQEILK